MPGMIQPERKLTWDENNRLTTVEVKSLFSGNWNKMEFGGVFYEDAVTRAQWNAWQAGEYIQRAMPQLGDEEREFLMTGATPQEWKAMEFEDDERTLD